MQKKQIQEMSAAVVKVVLLGVIFASISGCGLWNKSTQYQVPDYYETSHITTEPVVGKAYYVNDLRCKDTSSDGCNQQEEEVVQHPHRGYKKPYYLSK